VDAGSHGASTIPVELMGFRVREPGSQCFVVMGCHVSGRSVTLPNCRFTAAISSSPYQHDYCLKKRRKIAVFSGNYHTAKIGSFLRLKVDFGIASRLTYEK
jgi:hypothetical protein